MYQAGYQEGKSRGRLELANWKPGEHDSGCGCLPCLTVDMIARGLAEAWVTEAITVAIAGKLDENRVAELRDSIAGSAVALELLDAGAWAQAITEAYNLARVAVRGHSR